MDGIRIKNSITVCIRCLLLHNPHNFSIIYLEWMEKYIYTTFYPTYAYYVCCCRSRKKQFHIILRKMYNTLLSHNSPSYEWMQPFVLFYCSAISRDSFHIPNSIQFFIFLSPILFFHFLYIFNSNMWYSQIFHKNNFQFIFCSYSISSSSSIIISWILQITILCSIAKNQIIFLYSFHCQNI